MEMKEKFTCADEIVRSPIFAAQLLSFSLDIDLILAPTIK